MHLVPNKLTPVTALDVLKIFRAAFEKALGRTPSNSTLAILVAQSCLETGRWKSLHGWNWANVRPPKDWAGDYCQYRCNEKIDGKWVWFDPPSPGSNFVSFDDPNEGAEFYMTILMRRWPEAWTAALNGDSTAFVHGLKVRNFFTADETPYRTAVQKLCTEFFDYMNRGLVNPTPETLPAPHVPDMATIQATLAVARIASNVMQHGGEYTPEPTDQA